MSHVCISYPIQTLPLTKTSFQFHLENIMLFNIIFHSICITSCLGQHTGLETSELVYHNSVHTLFLQFICHKVHMRIIFGSSPLTGM